MATAELKNLSYEEKYNLATNEGTPTEILAMLANGVNPHVREYVRITVRKTLEERKVKNKGNMER